MIRKIILAVFSVLLLVYSVYSQNFYFGVNRNIDVPDVKISKTSEKAIFGENSMLDYYQADTTLKKLADSTVAFVFKSRFYHDPVNKVYRIKHLIKFSDAQYLSTTEDFANQQILSFCSGSLVAKDKILSAGHCVSLNEKDPNYYKKVYVVFGWKKQSRNSRIVSFKENQVYEISEIIKREQTTNMSVSAENLINKYHDYSILKLDRKVSDYTPLPLKKEELKAGDYVFTIGYPSGLYEKITKPYDSKIFIVGNSMYITNIDALGGNSGGPVFDSKTNKIVGVLVTGNGEYIYKLKNDVTMIVKGDASVEQGKISLTEGGIVVNDKIAEDVAKEFEKYYKAEVRKAGENEFYVTFKKGFSVENRDFVFSLILSVAGKTSFTRGKIVRLPQEGIFAGKYGVGTGVFKITPEIISLVNNI